MKDICSDINYCVRWKRKNMSCYFKNIDLCVDTFDKGLKRYQEELSITNDDKIKRIDKYFLTGK